MSQSLEDLHETGALRCAKLIRSSDGDRSIFYDSTFRVDCSESNVIKKHLVGLDGNEWQLSLVPLVPISFYFIKWLILFLSLALIFAGHIMAISLLNKEEERRKNVEEEKRFLENLTAQVRHDVASPISALRIAIDSSSLDRDMRNFLGKAVGRTEEIFNSLSTMRKATDRFSIDYEIQSILEEKKLVWNSKIQTEFDMSNRFLNLSRVEFSRMISNILNNAFEANASKLSIKTYLREEFFVIAIEDDGNSFPANILNFLGERNNTQGKQTGEGLGLWHGYHFMRSVQGELKISEDESKKVLLFFPLSRCC